MKYSVRTQSRAEFDPQQIYDWIKERSPEGALRWWTVLLDACQGLQQRPEKNALASAAQWSGRQVRQVLVQTRRGIYYRALDVIRGSEVQVLRVRGPGQPDLLPDDLV